MDTKGKSKDLVVMVGSDSKEMKAICAIIKTAGYATAICHDLKSLKEVLNRPCMAVILDVDSIPLDNRTIRELTIAYPGTYFLSISSRRYHPELKDAISYHLFGCLHKPIDPDEVTYFLKCICLNSSGSGP